MAEEEIKEETPETQNDTSDSTTEIETQEVQDDKNSNNDEQSAKQKKVPLLNKILFGLVGFLLMILLAGVVLFFMGFFDPVEEIKDIEIEKVERPIEKKNNFNIKDINSKKLNKQLQLLTNKNMIEEEKINKREKEEEEKKIKKEEEKKKEDALILEEEKLSKEKALLENKKLELEKQKKELELLKNEAIALRSEMINNKLEMEKKEEKTIQKEIKIEEPKIETINNEIKFVLLINVAKIKGSLYKSYLDKITNIYSDLKLCRDDINRIEIYYGPFEDNIKRSNIYAKLQENGIINSYKVELTKDEFNRRCNY